MRQPVRITSARDAVVPSDLLPTEPREGAETDQIGGQRDHTQERAGDEKEPVASEHASAGIVARGSRSLLAPGAVAGLHDAL